MVHPPHGGTEEHTRTGVATALSQHILSATAGSNRTTTVMDVATNAATSTAMEATTVEARTTVPSAPTLTLTQMLSVVTVSVRGTPSMYAACMPLSRWPEGCVLSVQGAAITYAGYGMICGTIVIEGKPLNILITGV
jgi:hypothetical protein